MSGVKNFLHIASVGADGLNGIECNTDKVPTNGSFIQWLFGWDGSQGFPSVAGNKSNLSGIMKALNEKR